MYIYIYYRERDASGIIKSYTYNPNMSHKFASRWRASPNMRVSLVR